MPTSRQVVGYCRVSTENQKDEGTIEIQEQALLAHAKAHGYELAEIFRDDGVSGGLENRPGLSAMLGYLESNPAVDGVLIFKLDRLARDIRIQENFIYDLQRRGKQLFSIKEPDLAGKEPDRVLHRHILGAFSQYEKATITMRLSLGRMRKAKKGGYAGGAPAFGYTTRDRELAVDEAEAVTVRDIFRMKRRQRMTLGQIARTLNERNVPTARGGSWYARTVKNILENPVYKGRMCYMGEKAERAELAVI